MFIWLISILGCLYFAAVISCFYVNRSIKKSGLKGVPFWQCFSIKKFFSIFLGFLLKKLIPLHVFEQYVLRFYDPYCRVNCIIPGKCVNCGCDSVAKGFSPLESCSEFNWPEIEFSKKKYDKLREDFPISIEIKYGQIS